jgi:hypothetical protein
VCAVVPSKAVVSKVELTVVWNVVVSKETYLQGGSSQCN